MLRISSDRDDQRIFWGLKFSILGGRKILASIVWGSLIEVGIFGGYSKQFEYSR